MKSNMKLLFASAIVSGLLAGQAVKAEEQAAQPPTDQPAVEKASCKGKANCKGKAAKKKKARKAAKGGANACSGKNGCDGM